MQLCYQQKWSIIGTKPVVLWLTAVGALTPHFVVESSAYSFIYCCCLFIFRWFVVVTVVDFLVSFVFCCCPVSSKHFIINFQLIWAEIIPVSCSNPNAIVAIRPAVRATIKVRIGISSRIVRNMHIIAPTKGWTMIIIAVSGVVIVAVSYVLFEVSIPLVVF